MTSKTYSGERRKTAEGKKERKVTKKTTWQIRVCEIERIFLTFPTPPWNFAEKK